MKGFYSPNSLEVEAGGSPVKGILNYTVCSKPARLQESTSNKQTHMPPKDKYCLLVRSLPPHPTSVNQFP